MKTPTGKTRVVKLRGVPTLLTEQVEEIITVPAFGGDGKLTDVMQVKVRYFETLPDGSEMTLDDYRQMG